MTVEVKALVKRFGNAGEVTGVDGVSFVAPRHHITSLLGPSGSGKSTILRLIAGLEIPDAGEIRIDEQEVTKVAVQKRQLGFVFQNYALFGHMSVFDNVAFGLSTRGVSKALIAERVQSLLELVQLAGYARRLPDQLSGGQRQRVALARALAPNPRVLLLDEPFGALDTQVRIELRDWLRRLHDETHVTTLLVTHDQEEALELSEHVVLLRDGHVEQAGTPEELYRSPANRFVAAFLGGAKIFRGSVQQGRAEFAQSAFSAAVDEADGSVVEAFVRPHDVHLEKAPLADASPNSAEIVRLVPVGNSVKIVLTLPDGDSLTIESPFHEVKAKGLVVGDRVLLNLRDVIVSPPLDFVI